MILFRRSQIIELAACKKETMSGSLLHLQCIIPRVVKLRGSPGDTIGQMGLDSVRALLKWPGRPVVVAHLHRDLQHA